MPCTRPPRHNTRAALLLLALPPLAALAQDSGAASDNALPELSALLECRSGYEGFMAYVPVLRDPLRAVALGWRPQPQTNPFMVEYRLNAPVTVFGRQSDHIAFAGDGVVAVLDLADPRTLARELQLETGVDTPEKAIFGREARASEVTGPDGTTGWIESAIINVSNVDSHPGKTLAGCSYSLDAPEPAEPAVSDPVAPATASPATAQPR
ncbi:hypothetical protein [Pseudoxanthomonas daejeonensis]|uniref:Secreted protein n=1 Tax=Pseudoxanthomonas daejeonensis TaxID=266062 RepID=A0ABQ6Z7A2_9GAMM|nr:hypothetical protein [Pseudoxanthomonas daejeonensis]KAF1694751.1 hypothetical protein CSC65_08655 [Pseudoxanthomonas daejeonensis]